MKKLIIIPIILLAINGFCDETIVDFSENTIPVLNEELRKIDESNVALEARVATLEAAGSSYSQFSASMTAAQSVNTGTLTKITWDTEDFDSDSVFGSSKFTAPSAGKWLINVQVSFNSIGAGKICELYLYKNGSSHIYTFYFTPNISSDAHVQLTKIISVAANDYFEVYVQHNHGSARNIGGATGQHTWFQGTELS